ncbi:phosphoadenylyl-sulfate reductase [Paracoccaceae bacterium GXU_MW_L88]
MTHPIGQTKALLHEALVEKKYGDIAVVSSFGAESVAMLHLISEVAPDAPILFIDTFMLFEETLQYQVDVAKELGLTNIQVVRATDEMIKKVDPFGRLHMADPDACCNLRKTVPLDIALESYDGWINGRRRGQTQARSELPPVETDEHGRTKINPMFGWLREDVLDHITRYKLPRHPLVAQGYPSIGCAPCTSKVAPGEDPRSGRWRGQNKEECGIHVSNGQIQRGKPMKIRVTDTGFEEVDSVGEVALEEVSATPDVLAVENTTPISDILPHLGARAIRIPFPVFSDGRGFTLARAIRDAGYEGDLTAVGHVLADQYDLARRSGFDAVEISPEQAQRQPEAQWQAHKPRVSYQQRLRG